MITFPNAKINIGLNILSKREDGYHNLQTIFYPVGIKDALEIINAGEQQQEVVAFTGSGLPVQGRAEDNLCIKAFYLLQKDFPQLTAVKMHLHKTIPMGAGMGGGSADAAFALQLLNDKFKLNLSLQELVNYALQLGSDCPFFLLNQPCYATGRGEIMEPVSADLSVFQILIINPGIHINTAKAFSQIETGKNTTDLRTLVAQPIDQWRHTVVNDFESSVFAQYPNIADIKDELYRSGALYASMSGSGSTVYGIFAKGDQPVMNFPAHYFYRWV